MRRLFLLAVVVAALTGCEWPWRSSSLTLTADLWTDRVHGDLRLQGISGMLFDCRTHADCVSAVRRALQVPETVPESTEVSGDVGARLVQVGAEGATLALERSKEGVDLVAHFSAPASSALFRDELGLTLQTTGEALLRMQHWSVSDPANLPTRQGPEGSTEVLLADAPRSLTLAGPGNPDSVPLLLWLPGLDRVLVSEGLLPE